MPNRVIVRFADDDYQNMLLGKPITCDDGSVVQLTIKKDWNKQMDASSTVFRRTAEVIQVGSNVDDIEIGDTAIMDYKVDNDESIVVGRDDVGKLVACLGVSKYYKQSTYRYANRLNQKDMLMDAEGSLEGVSDILGVIRNGKLIAKDPYVFLKFQSPKEMKVSSAGIIFEEQIKQGEYEVLSVSKRSREKYNIIDGSTVTVTELDTFVIDLPNGQTVLVCNDSDIKLCRDGLKFNSISEFINALK